MKTGMIKGDRVLCVGCEDQYYGYIVLVNPLDDKYKYVVHWYRNNNDDLGIQYMRHRELVLDNIEQDQYEDWED